ncbi:hypothetical protein F2Q70_00016748 [Brassica cretica]|uniref:Uncharacterized protein n=1 Tax=Brassica cretica TaxID=69181 RepID=A0A8S9KZJ1_BRACR|nr:hypothetical protein F2Q70_00016748 [Brassica cretica]KAF2599147.1 hypothetical protein F2Q68_00009725 [Brassica cretica]
MARVSATRTVGVFSCSIFKSESSKTDSDRDETRASSIRSRRRELRGRDEDRLVDPARRTGKLDCLFGPTVAVPTTEVPIIRKGPTTRSGSRVIRAGFAKAVQELLAQEQTGFKLSRSCLHRNKPDSSNY